MTWAERVGDVATRLALVILLALRIITELLRLLFMTLERFVVDLGERTEEGLRRTEVAERGWVRLPGSVLLGIAFAILQLLAIFMACSGRRPRRRTTASWDWQKGKSGSLVPRWRHQPHRQ